MGILSRWIFQILAGVAIGLFFGILIIGIQQVRARQAESAAATDIPVMINGTPAADCKRSQWPAASASITPGGISVKPGEAFSVQVMLDTAAPSQGIQFGLSFDTRALEFVSVNEGSFYKDWASAHGATTILLPSAGVDTQKNRLNTLAIAVLKGPEKDGATGSGQVGTIQLRARAGTSGRSTLTLDDVVVSGFNLCGIPDGVDPVLVTGATVAVGEGSAPPAAPSPLRVSPHATPVPVR